MNTLTRNAVVLALIAVPVAAAAQEPAQNVSSARHGNLAAAQALVRQASDRLTAAQRANEFDLGGHASHAKDLLRQASQEIRMAATTVNQR